MQKHGQELPREIQTILESIEGLRAGTDRASPCSSNHETGEVSTECSVFWTCSEILLPFTSPIRRYRIFRFTGSLKDKLRGRLEREKTEHYKEILEDVAHGQLCVSAGRTKQRENLIMKKQNICLTILGKRFEESFPVLLAEAMWNFKYSRGLVRKYTEG